MIKKNDASLSVDASGGERNVDRIGARALYLFFHTVQFGIGILLVVMNILDDLQSMNILDDLRIRIASPGRRFFVEKTGFDWAGKSDTSVAGSR